MLPLAPKSLMPEILPGPPQVTGARVGPRERVRERFLQLRDRSAVLAAAAGFAVACDSAGPGGGYGVVDPLPPPFTCPSPEMVTIGVLSARWEEIGGILVRTQAVASEPQIVGLHDATLDPAAVEAGISLTIGRQANPGPVRLELGDGGSWPDQIELRIGYLCVSNSQATGPMTRYVLVLRLDTSAPAAAGDVPYQVITADDTDGG